MIKRQLQDVLQSKFFKGKAILLFGPRQVGKSTLIETLLNAQNKQWIYFNGDDDDVRENLTNTSSTKLKGIIGNNEIVFMLYSLSNSGFTFTYIFSF